MNKNIVIQQSYSVDLKQNKSDFVVPQKYEGESPYGHVKETFLELISLKA